MSKFKTEDLENLRAYLAENQGSEYVDISYEDFEKKLNIVLPDKAKEPSWWINNPRWKRAKYWLDAKYKTHDAMNFKNTGNIVFRREKPTGNQESNLPTNNGFETKEAKRWRITTAITIVGIVVAIIIGIITTTIQIMINNTSNELPHPDSPSTYFNHAKTLIQQGQFDMAIENLYRAIDSQSILSEDFVDYEIATMRVFLSRSYRNIMNFNMAHQHALKALSDFGQLNPDGTGIITALNEMGRLLTQMGLYEDAIGYFYEAIGLSIQYYGSEYNYFTAIIKDHKASAFERFGDYDSAYIYATRAYMIWAFLDIDGFHASERSIAANNFLLVLLGTERFEEALLHVTTLIENDGANATISPFQRAIRYTNFARVFIKNGYYESASRYLRYALRNYVAVSDNIGIAETHLLLGMTYYHLGVYGAALLYFGLSEEHGIELLGISDSIALMNIRAALIYEMRHDYLSALEMAEIAVSHSINVHGIDNVNTILVTSILARMQLKNGNYNNSWFTLSELIDVAQRVIDRDSLLEIFLLARLYLEKANVYVYRQNFDIARDYIITASWTVEYFLSDENYQDHPLVNGFWYRVSNILYNMRHN